MTTTYALVGFPSPKVTGPACQTCEGLGVTGEQYQMQTDPGRPDFTSAASTTDEPASSPAPPPSDPLRGGACR